MKRIMIVEDDPDILETMKMALGRLYTVETSMNAAPIFESNFTQPDLFIIDKQLSGTSGAELCVQLKTIEASKNIPVILMSASPDIRTIAVEAGATDALEKPFSLGILRSLVAKYIG